MVNINLASAGYEGERQSGLYAKGTLLIVLTLAIVLVGWIAIIFLTKNTEEKIQNANAQYDAELKKLLSNKDVVDFQNRIAVAKDLLAQKNFGYLSLPAIEKSVVSGAYLRVLSFDQDKKTVTLDGVTDNFDVLARQILSLKQSDYFSQVEEGSTKMDDKGKVNFTLNLKIK